MYHPSLEKIRQLEEYGNLVPIYREVNADTETPVSAYLKIARGEYSFLLESVEGGERLARYSFIGTEPSSILKTEAEEQIDPLFLIEKELNLYHAVPVAGLPRFHGGMVGYISYEVARYFEELPVPDSDPVELPESVFMMADTLLAFDHLTHKIKIISHVRLDSDIDAAYHEATKKIDILADRLKQPLHTEEKEGIPSIKHEISSNFSPAEFYSVVNKAKEYIYAGDAIQIVLSQRLARHTHAAPFAIYRALRSINPSPYMYYLQMNNFCIVGASPELLVRLEEGTVSNHPIAGTRPRGKDPVEDLALEKELREDEKECAEHIMLVDLARNDVGKVSQIGTVEITQLMDVERYSHVMHLVSHVQGKVQEGLSQFDVFRACFPAGTVSGAPKIRAMEIITELEKEKRGPYAGAVGYFGLSGNMDTAITIRTLFLKDNIAYVQAGCGIVADSVPESEYLESLNKAQGMFSAIDQAESD